MRRPVVDPNHGPNSTERHALYYPEWGIPDPALLVELLLYWDRLACIVPFEGFSPIGAVDKEFRKASDALHERFVTGLVPTAEQKDAVHHRIEEVIERIPPERYRPENLTPGQRATISALKIDWKTVRMLRERGWARPDDSDGYEMQHVSLAAANLILGELVAEFESERLPALTGDRAAYAATTNALLHDLGSDTLMSSEAYGMPGPMDPQDQAAVLILPFIRAGMAHDSVTPKFLERVLTVRSDPDVEGYRKQFVAHVDTYVETVRMAGVDERPLIMDDWRNALALDRRRYTEELSRAGLAALVDKESMVSVLIGSGLAGFAPLALGPVGLVFGVTLSAIRTAMRFRAGRDAVASERWTSFLFALEPSRLGVRL